ELLERRLVVPVVVLPLERDRDALLPSDVAVRARAGRTLVEAFQSFLVPLRLADDPEVVGARDRVIHGGRRLLHAKHDLVVVDDLHFLDAPPEWSKRYLRFLPLRQRIAVRDVLRGERPVAEVELDARAQPEGPLPEVRAGLPLLCEARHV